MEYIERAEELVGYKAKVWHREPFAIVGYTLIVAPGADRAVPDFYTEATNDGRMAALRACSSAPTWMLGLSTWDKECEKKGYRYTICIEETQHTDFTALAQRYPLFRLELGASDWLCFEMDESKYFERFWKDNPYAMMKPLGFRFGTHGLNLGCHFDAYPPTYSETDLAMEFWITVEKRRTSAAE